MDFSELYVWRPVIRQGPLHIRPVDEEVDDYALLRGNVVLTEPLKFVRSLGRSPGDIIPTELAAIVLISDKIVQLLQREEVTGWNTYPVEVIGQGRRSRNWLPWLRSHRALWTL